MAVRLTGEYIEPFQTQLTHEPSGSSIATDAPVDNGGKGSRFSPTDLLTASYAACMMTIMGLRAAKKDLSLDGLAIDVSKHMTSTPPRRIAKLEFVITMPRTLNREQQDWLLQEAKSCPVALSVHPDIELDFKIY